MESFKPLITHESDKPSDAQDQTKNSDSSIKKLKKGVRLVELWLKRGERVITIDGLSACFKIETLSDVYRLNKGFEGKYAREIIATLKKLGKEGITVNIGAAQGFYTIYAALAGNSTIAIEPDPATFEALQVNVDLNKLTGKVKCIKCAIGDENGEETLFTDGIRNSAPSFIKTKNKTEEVKVPVFRMDEIIEDNPKVLIVDVEGYEEKVIRGMGELRPKEIFIEIHPDFLTKIGQDKNSVHKLLFSMGYELKSQYQRKTKTAIQLLCHFTLKDNN